MGLSIDGLVVIAVLILANGLLGTMVFARNTRSALNRMFLVMTTTVTIWAVSSVVSDDTGSYSVAHIASFLAFGGGFLAISSGYFFSEAFRRGKLPRTYLLQLLGTVALAVSFSTPLVYELTTYTTYRNGPLYFPYLLVTFAFMALIANNFYQVIRTGDGIKRNHARFMVTGIAGTAVLAMLTNAIIPALVDITWITKIGPIFTILLVSSVAYTIIRHRMFDIRLAVARSLAYVMTLLVIASVYSVLLIGVLSHFIAMEYSSWLQQFAYIAMAVILSLTFQPIKRFFDKFTNRLFYKDAYDPQELSDQLNRALVSSLELGFLATKSSEIIAANLKANRAIMAIFDTEERLRVYGTHRNLARDADALKDMMEHIPHRGQKIVVADYLDQHHEHLKSLMQKNDVALIIRLTHNSRSTDAIGYVMLGGKQSGNAYNDQDIRVLENIANELIIAIQNALHYEEIQRFNELLQARVDEATHKLRRTNTKLRDLDETKDDFISMASHQLRTPLTSVKGYLSMVLEGDAGEINETQKKMLGQAFVSSQRMVYLIADLLNVSRLRTGKFIIESVQSDLSKMIEEELAQLVETAAAREITLTYDKPKDFPLLMLDETKTRQVVMNFADNAIYYTPAGGHIKVELTTTDTAAELRVVDDGIGVPKAEQHHLFTKFYRAGNARKARPDGTGLGLFMAKKVILAQGGTVLFDSHEGKGSTFGFSFPLSKLRVQATEPAPQPIAKIPVAK